MPNSADASSVDAVHCWLAAARGPLRQAAVPDNYWMKHFRAFGDMCKIGCWSLWSWFNVNHFDDDMREKLFLHFRSRWPSPLTFRPQILLPIYFCPAVCLHQFISFCGFPVSRKSKAWDRRTRGRTDGRRWMLNVAPYWGYQFIITIPAARYGTAKSFTCDDNFLFIILMTTELLKDCLCLWLCP